MDAKMSRSVMVCATLISLTPAYSQMDPIATDRPDQTESPAIVPAGWYQFEGGCAHERAGADEPVEGTLPTVLSKVGLTRWAELRVITERARTSTTEGGQVTAHRLVPVEVGAKFRLMEERGLLPCVSLIGHMGLPFTAEEPCRPATAFGNFRFTLQHTLSERFSLGYNLGAEWDGERPVATGIYTLTLGAEATETLGFFVEAYGYINDMDAADHRLDGGAVFHIGPDVLLDASSGFSLGEHRWFVSAGLSFRVPVFVRRAPLAG